MTCQSEKDTLLFLEECEILVEIIQDFRKTSYETNGGYQISCLYLVFEVEELQDKLLRALDKGDKKWKNTYLTVIRQLKRAELKFHQLERDFSSPSPCEFLDFY